MKTTKEFTKSGHWPMTKENTWYGYKTNTGDYEWWKTKKTAIKHMPNKKGWIMRATLIKEYIYINTMYSKMGGFTAPF